MKLIMKQYIKEIVMYSEKLEEFFTPINLRKTNYGFRIAL